MALKYVAKNEKNILFMTKSVRIINAQRTLQG